MKNNVGITSGYNTAILDFGTVQKRGNLVYLYISRLLEDDASIAKFDVDTIENGPSKVRITYLPVISDPRGEGNSDEHFDSPAVTDLRHRIFPSGTNPHIVPTSLHGTHSGMSCHLRWH